MPFIPKEPTIYKSYTYINSLYYKLILIALPFFTLEEFAFLYTINK